MKKWTLVFAVLVTSCLSSCGSDDMPGPDFDNDGIEDIVDTDDDNDGVVDSSDAFPLNAKEQLDTDNDGIGNNADTDDDNDGALDLVDAFPLDPQEQLDTDSDGIGNNRDKDDDSDGYQDSLDAFPLDPSEQLDTDNDGVGNHQDMDDDNDGVLDDVDALPLDATESEDSDLDGAGDNSDHYPEDPSCHKEQHGNGQACYLSMLKQDNNVLSAAGGQYIYFVSNSDSKVIRFDAQLQNFTTVAELNVDKGVTQLFYQPRVNRLFVRYHDNTLNYVDSDGIEQTTGITLNQNSVVRVADEYLVINLFQQEYSVYDRNLQLINNVTLPPIVYFSGASWNEPQTGQLSAAKWDHLHQTLMIVQGSDIFHLTVDDSNKTVKISSQSAPFGERDIAHRFEFLPDNKYGLFADGTIHSLYGYYHDRQVRTFPTFDLSLNLNEQGFVTISNSDDGFALRWYNSELLLLDQLSFKGTAKSIFRHGNTLYVLSDFAEHMQLNSYELNQDIDGDDIQNQLDAFPLDKAAAIDSDGDSYPDVWVDGYGEGDSRDGLLLDIAPTETSYWLEQHINDDSCVYQSSMNVPSYGAETVITSNGVVYIYLNSQRHLIYRYSLAQQKYLPSLQLSRLNDLGGSIQALTWSERQQRLYIGYVGGLVSYIEPEKSTEEVYFANVSTRVRKIWPADNYIIVDGYDLFEFFYGDHAFWHVLDSNGKTTDRKEFHIRGRPMELDYIESLEQYTFSILDFPFVTFGNFGLDQSKGLFTEPVSNLSSIRKSLRDGTYYIDMNGTVFNAEGEQILNFFKAGDEDFQDTYDIFELEEYVALYSYFTDELRIYRIGSFELVNEMPFENVTKLISYEGKLVRVWIEDDKYRFTPIDIMAN